MAAQLKKTLNLRYIQLALSATAWLKIETLQTEAICFKALSLMMDMQLAQRSRCAGSLTQRFKSKRPWTLTLYFVTIDKVVDYRKTLTTNILVKMAHFSSTKLDQKFFY